MEKNQYTDALRLYQNSPAYQQYLLVKDKAEQQQQQQLQQQPMLTPGRPLDESIPMKPTSMAPAVYRNGGEPTSSLPVAIESHYDDLGGRQMMFVVTKNRVSDLNEVPAAVHAAYARYSRNQRLMLDIMNDVNVPDCRAVVTVPRLQMLKRQAQSLTLHQTKLDAELLLLSERFQTKRKCIDDQRDKYLASLDSVGCFLQLLLHTRTQFRSQRRLPSRPIMTR